MKLKKAFIIILAIFALMYVEYRYIICNLNIYRGENATMYVEIFGNVDEYYVEFEQGR